MASFLKKTFSRSARQDASWHNWSGHVSCTPANRIAPKSLEELAAAVKSAKGTIRPVGSGHSFSPLVPTEGTIISLEGFKGLKHYDPKTLEATFGAGTPLHEVGEPLHNIGQALKNMGDIDAQTLAGALSTATHGTGANLSSLSASITGLELVTAAGEVLWCDKDTNPDVFTAAKVSLGALGIITKIRLQNREPYMLERNTWTAPLEDVLENLETLARENRNIEFFFIPYSDIVSVSTLNEAPAGTKAFSPRDKSDKDLKTLRRARRFLGWSKKLHRAALNFAIRAEKPERAVGQSYKIYPTARNTRFNEMEYHLPREAAGPAMREIRDAIYNQKLDVAFPVEFRLVAADDAWLSPFYGRKSCSIAVHQFHDKDPAPYFGVIEPILRKYGGRPHWGKQHTLGAQDLAKLYPHWNDFLTVRENLDPEGKFLNAHLAHVLGVAPQSRASAPKIKGRKRKPGNDA
jgi:FAD-linked oxidoreductase